MIVYDITDAWVDLNTLSGVEVGTQVTLQNVSTKDILVILSDTQPAVVPPPLALIAT